MNLTITSHNETYIKIDSDDFGILTELSEFFTFYAQNYKFMPAYKSGMFDGKIRLYNLRTKLLYKGLIKVVFKFAKDNEYRVSIAPELNPNTGITKEEVVSFMNNLQIPKRIEIRDYQYEAVYQALKVTRSVLQSSTSSGKSLMLYAIIRWHLNHNRNIVLIVPSVSLVQQMYSDYLDYASESKFDFDSNVQLIFSGQDRDLNKPITISTWQSLLSMMKSDRKTFDKILSNDVALYDEIHGMKSTEVVKVIESFNTTKYRTGTTGTLDGISLNELTITGLMGPVYKVISARELIDRGQAVEIRIKAFVLHYDSDYKKQFNKKLRYQDEIDILINSDKRNNFIAELTTACTGNTLVLFNYIAHGEALLNKIRERICMVDRNIYFITGEMPPDKREQIRKQIEKENNGIIVATASLLSTGTNIPSLSNLILTMPGKSNIRIPQSIGRGMRLKDGKTECKVFDIADDLRIKKSQLNHSLQHLHDRIKIYINEEFPYTITDVNL